MKTERIEYSRIGRYPLLIVAICCVVVLNGCGGVPVKTVDLETLLRDVEVKAYLVQRFRAQFVQTRRTELFTRDLTVRGNLVFEKPNKFHLTLGGDVNVEILSDGDHMTMIHDGKDRETFRLHGERDVSKFADPLMVLLQSMGNGGLRKFSLARNVSEDGSVILQAVPTGQTYFERTRKIELRLSATGEIQTVVLDFGHGNRDETVFQSWSMLAQNDPEIVKLHNRLRAFSREASPQSENGAELATSTLDTPKRLGPTPQNGATMPRAGSPETPPAGRGKKEVALSTVQGHEPNSLSLTNSPQFLSGK
jgi:outer membrane lipoprotein-sorting protein